MAARARLAAVVGPLGRGKEELAGLDDRGRELRNGVAEVDARLEGAVATGATERFSAAVLALVGGFSANVLYRVLARISESVELLLVGRVAAQVPESARTAAAQAEQRAAQDRMAAVREVLALRSQLGNDMTEAARARLDAFIERQLGSMTGSGPDMVSDVRALPPGDPDEQAAATGADATPPPDEPAAAGDDDASRAPEGATGKETAPSSS